MRVPGKQGSLLQAKARGADVRIVYSPMDALKLAQENPTRKVVFFGLGFETTMPTTAITLQQAKARDVQNFYFFCQHITLIPTLRSLLEQPDNGIDAFLAPGHVSMVIGTDAYNFIASDFHRPLVVAGFEPLDLLQGVVMLVEQKIAAHSKVENQYRRVVPDAGNLLAQQAIAEMIEALDKVTPGIASDETLLYGVEVKFYSNKVVVDKDFCTSVKGLRAIGDGASVTRGLQQASANGLSVARSILKSMK